MTRSGIHRRIVALAIPAIGTLVADPLLGLVDTAVAGRLGAQALAGLGTGVAVLATVSWVFNFLVYGTTAWVARAIGAGDTTSAGRRVAHAAWAAVAIGVVVAVILFVAAGPLLRFFGVVPSIIDPATTYLRIRALGVLGLLVGYVGHGAFRGVSDTRTPLVIVVAANVLNGTLDVVLVYVFGMGLAGIAWATVAAELLAALAFVVLIGRAGLPLSGHGHPRFKEVRELVAVSRDLFLRTGALVFGLLAVSIAAARISATVAAAYQVTWQVWLFVSFAMDGFAIAAQALVGTALGAGRPDEARATAAALVRWGLWGGATAAIALLAMGFPVVRLLTDEPEVIALALGTAWWVAMGSHVVNGLVFVLDGVVMGASDFAYLRTWTVVAAIVAAALSQVAATAGWGLVGLWVAVEAMMLVRFTALTVRVRGDAWTRA